jgi:aspartyl aminopeptidase
MCSGKTTAPTISNGISVRVVDVATRNLWMFSGFENIGMRSHVTRVRKNVPP